MTDTLSAREKKILELELVQKFRAFGRPAALAELFGGCEPAWASAALARLLAAGLVTVDGEGRVTPAKAG